MSNRKVIELLVQLKSAKAHGKNYIMLDHPRSAIFCVIFCIVTMVREELNHNFAVVHDCANGKISARFRNTAKKATQVTLLACSR